MGVLHYQTDHSVTGRLYTNHETPLDMSSDNWGCEFGNFRSKISRNLL